RNRKQLRKKLRELLGTSAAVPRPVHVKYLKENTTYARSYALKTTFSRRIGFLQTKRGKNGKRKCRNSTYDKLRVSERIELFTFLHQIGLADRVFFLGAKAVVNGGRVEIRPC